MSIEEFKKGEHLKACSLGSDHYHIWLFRDEAANYSQNGAAFQGAH